MPIGKMWYLCYRGKKSIVHEELHNTHFYFLQNLPLFVLHDARRRLGRGYNSTLPLMLLTPLFFLQLLSTSPLMLQSLSP